MADMQKISCPNCGAEIELTEVMTQSLRREFEAKASAREKALTERMTQRIAEEKQKALADADRAAEQRTGVEMKELRETLAERDRKLRVAQEAELDLRKQQRALEERHQEMELEIARKLDAERSKIGEEAKKQALEQERLKLSEKEKVIDDLKKQLTLAQQKAEQGSMQLQGEVLELDLEGRLAAAFPFDGIEPVAKGVKGADAIQRVRTNTGGGCGAILWEAKRTKNWSPQWPGKLKEDQREAKAEVAVLVTQAKPADIQGFGQVDGVWVCDYLSALPLAAALRQGLVGVASARQAEAGKAGKMEQLYDYLAGTEFRHRIEAVVETFVGLQVDLDKERRAMERIWKSREKQIEQAITHTASLYGGVQGIVGQGALPGIKSLELELGEESE
jgi:hypothetical protein